MDVVCHVITKLELGSAEVAMQVVSSLIVGDSVRCRLQGPDGLLTVEAHALQGVELQLIPSMGRRCNCCTICVPSGNSSRPSDGSGQRLSTPQFKSWYPGRVAAWLAGVPCILYTIHGYGVTPAQPFWLQRLLIGLEWMVGRVTTH